jgi:hypothetical protein
MLWLGWGRGEASEEPGGGMLGTVGLSIGVEGGGFEKSAALPHGPGSSYFSNDAGSDTLGLRGTLGLVGASGNRQRRGPSSSRQPSRMLCPSGWMTDTAVLVKTILQPRSAKGPKPMREWGKEGITWPRIAEGGRDGADARVALATDLSGRPFATRTPTVGALWSRLATGASGEK